MNRLNMQKSAKDIPALAQSLGQPIPEPISEVQYELNFLHESTESLRGSLEILERRLDPVLRPASPAPEDDQSLGVGGLSYIGKQIADARANVNLLQAYLASLMDRLAV